MPSEDHHERTLRFMNPNSTTNDRIDFEDLGIETVQCVTRECEECGEEYETALNLVVGYRAVCPDCRLDEPPEIDFDRVSKWPGSSIPDEPLMEFGPHSEGKYDE